MSLSLETASSSSQITPLDSKSPAGHPTSIPSKGERPDPPTYRYEFQVVESSRRTSVPWHDRLARSFGIRDPRVRKVLNYVRGPRPKVDLPAPTPLLNRKYQFKHLTFTISIERYILQLTHPFTSVWLFIILAIGYTISFAFFSRSQSFLTPSNSFIDCTATYWAANDGCGLDGGLCAPFTNSTFDFRCPAQCNQVVLENPRTVGDQQVEYVPLIVGGGDPSVTYRGDSFVCAAAVQAGIISNSRGGCASLQLVGNFTDYLPFTAHGLTSIGFPSVFPLSFQFSPSTSLTHCEDLRTPALAFNVLVTAFIFLVLRPKPLLAFWSLVCIGFWHVSLFSQPSAAPPALDVAFGSFLPALFVAYGLWRVAYRFTMPVFAKMPLEASVWYLAPFWVGILANVIFNKLPIDRLLASDLAKRPGAVTALVVIVVVLLIIALNQARVIRKTGWLPHYLAWYVFGGLLILVLSFLPGLELRLHHYIIALALIPGTAFPTRLSAIYQGFLLGLFLNGVAAFGFASILQTSADLRRDAAIGTDLPSFLTNSSSYQASTPLQNQTIFWDVLPDASLGWDSFALLVDDVERYVGTALNFSLASLQTGIPHFFRLAYVSDGTAGDFTMSATLWPNGTWVDPLPGPS